MGKRKRGSGGGGGGVRAGVGAAAGAGNQQEQPQAVLSEHEDHAKPEEAGIVSSGAECRVSLSADKCAVLDGRVSVRLHEGEASILGASLPLRKWTDLRSDLRVGSGTTINCPSGSAVLDLRCSPYSEGDCITTQESCIRGDTFTLDVAPFGVNPAATVISHQWQAAVDSIASNHEAARTGKPAPVAVLYGSTNVGKSTLARLLVNKLLCWHSRVAYLETDVGQCEFTPPGMVALHVLSTPVHGPPSCHLRDPVRAYFIGDITPKSDPELCFETTCNLYGYFRDHYLPEGVPLVVNTHGWVKGIGLDILIELLRYIQPSHVVQVQSGSKAANKSLLKGTFWLQDGNMQSNSTALHTVPRALVPDRYSQLKTSTSYRSRAVQFAAYFQPDCLSTSAANSSSPPSITDTLSGCAQSLACAVPYVVPLSAVRLEFYCEVPPSEQLRALNGSLVGLASDTKECFGLGIVRAVDPRQKLLYILTPVAQDKLQQCTVLQCGRLELPSSLLRSADFCYPYLNDESISTEKSGSAAIKSRHNLLRRSLHA
eukprot:jgi/Chlat1/7165/Chrsp57S06747